MDGDVGVGLAFELEALNGCFVHDYIHVSSLQK
jgi:hypothetical protein